MEVSEGRSMVFKRIDLLDIIVKAKTAKLAVELVSEFVLNQIGNPVSAGQRHLIADFFHKTKYKLRETRNSHSKERLLKNESTWLSNPLLDFRGPSNASPTTNPSPVSYENARRSKQYEIVAEIKTSLLEYPVEAILRAVSSICTEKGNKNAAYVLKKIIQDEKGVAELIRKYSDHQDPIAYTAEESLSLILDEDLSVTSYKALRQGSIDHGFALYPSYKEVLAQKRFCRPDEMPKCSDIEVSVSLQSLKDHTIGRLVELQKPVFAQLLEQTGQSDITLHVDFSWGYDGSSGQSRYKQQFENPNSNDSSLLATVIIPLRITLADNHDLVFWANPSPQSPRHCRLLHLQMMKESKDLILAEHKYFLDQEKCLKTFSTTLLINNIEVRLRFESKFHCSVIDGKIYSIITKTSSQQSCPICGAKPSEMNRLDVLATKSIKPGSLCHGIIPLHCWIRLYDFCLHLAYRDCNGIRSWQINTDEKKRISSAKKQYIQDQMRLRLGLLVDMPNPGGSGTTNDGNSSRKAFREHEIFAEITGLEPWVNKELYQILCIISAEHLIDADKFQIMCNKFLDKYLLKYNWFYMPVSLHKILVHGPDLVRASTLPLGVLSEQAGESRNKIYRQDREHHARKCSRKANLQDVFNRAMDSSDPIMAHNSRCTKRRKSTMFSAEVINVFKPPTIPPPACNSADAECFTENFEIALDGIVLEPEYSLFDHVSAGWKTIIYLDFKKININYEIRFKSYFKPI